MICTNSTFPDDVTKEISPRWKVSCAPPINKRAYKKLSENSFQFHVDVGDVGGCETDRRSYKDKYIEFQHSERQELASRKLGIGYYEFSANISIKNTGLFSYRNSIFQIHDDRNKGVPPVMFNRYGGRDGKANLFRVNHRKIHGLSVPAKPFDLIVRFEITKRYVLATYYIDGEQIATSKEKYNNKPYIKIGIYRIMAKSSVTQTYRNVRLVRIERKRTEE